ncbi:hypothetical protein KPSA3_04630 [Pseudomonas syringae pv. actinidiae]|uniref:Uncharacterized protein n=1 Tax=Pseudomonas syringae pv. actinidiae TaxID=103796 RepID=A0AAN4Q7H7_PSESF|nr:hypothetical protein KPSA3_04630 [Pseudomonas syringae pv. actinidiae]
MNRVPIEGQCIGQCAEQLQEIPRIRVAQHKLGRKAQRRGQAMPQMLRTMPFDLLTIQAQGQLWCIGGPAHRHWRVGGDDRSAVR